MPYKNLSLDRDLIESTIREYPDVNVEGPTNLPGNVMKYVISPSNDPKNKGVLNVHYNNGGTISFNFQGSNQDLMKEVASLVKSKCTKGSLTYQTFSFGFVKAADFSVIKEYLTDICGATVTQSSIKNAVNYTFIGKNSDTLTITYYTTTKLVIQCKQQFLYSDLIEIITSFVDYKSIIEQQLKTFDVNSSIDETLAEFRELFSSSYSYLGDTIIAIISPSLTFKKMNIALTDYSSFVFPILRGLEGFLKKVLKEYSIQVKKEGFKDVFEPIGNTYQLKEEYRISINNPGICSTIVDLYKFYKMNRHALFHTDGDIESTKLISSKTEAEKLIYKATEVIEGSYMTLKTVNKDFGKTI